jgi:hypothetical protein
MSWVAVAIGVGTTAVAIVQLVDSSNQRKKAEKMKPKYEIPEEVGVNQDLAQQVAYEGLPAASRNAFNKEVQRSQASMLARTGELQAGISAMATAQVANQDALANLYSRDAEMRIRGKQMQMHTNLDAARARDKTFDIDFAAYQQQLASAQAMAGAGQQNLVAGIGSVAGGMGSFGAGKSDTGNPLTEKQQELTFEQQMAADMYGTQMGYTSPSGSNFFPDTYTPPNIVTSQNYGSNYVE